MVRRGENAGYQHVNLFPKQFKIFSVKGQRNGFVKGKPWLDLWRLCSHIGVIFGKEPQSSALYLLNTV